MSAQTIETLGEIETEAEEAAYAEWMRTMVKEADDDPRPGIPHDVVMEELDALLAGMKVHQQKAHA